MPWLDAHGSSTEALQVLESRVGHLGWRNRSIGLLGRKGGVDRCLWLCPVAHLQCGDGSLVLDTLLGSKWSLEPDEVPLSLMGVSTLELSCGESLWGLGTSQRP